MRKDAGKFNKLRGGYYTPTSVARWLTSWAIRSGDDRILEPSCGDGTFLASAISVLQSYENGNAKITGIELMPDEAKKSSQKISKNPFANVICDDFFNWLRATKTASYDVIIGNPPFIRYQHFPEPSRSLAMAFMEAQGLRPNRLTNIWVPFVVASINLLRKGGRLAMVLPAELLQVTYAAQLRQYLADSFEKISIFSCNEIFFENAEQEVVLLLAEGKLDSSNSSNFCDISLVETNSLEELLRSKPNNKRNKADRKYVKHDSEKWLKYFLDKDEIDFIRTLRAHKSVGTLSDHASIDVGVVTGENAFFVVSQEQVKKSGLERFVIPLVSRSAQLSGAILSKQELQELAKSGKPVYLLYLTGHNTKEFPIGLRNLIAYGESQGFNQGYKCSIRKPWYNVPSVWEPDCFFFRQIYDFPRVVVNKAGATSTDTIHRMKCNSSASRIAANLYTHLTAASAEIEGRSYGGGVLELEPTEAERLLVPKELNGAMTVTEADKLVRKGRLADVLEYNDRVVLQGALRLSKKDCKMLKQIWSKMRDRRMSRSRR